MRQYTSTINRRLSMESIDFQTDKTFPRELDKLTQEIIDITKDTKPLNQRNLELVLKDTNKKIDALFKERFGITTTLQVNLNTLAHTIPFIINKNHVLLKNGYRGLIKDKEQDSLLKNYHNKKGTIDLKKAKVTGIFSEYKHLIAYNPVMFVQLGASAREISAIILHEIGHGFTFYEFSHRVDELNSTLADLLVRLRHDGEFSSKKYEYIFKDSVRKGQITQSEMDDLVNSNVRVIFGLKLFKAYVGNVCSQMANNKYNLTTSENLADTFVSRLGYHREIITGLDKVYLAYGSPEKSSSGWMYYFGDFSLFAYLSWFSIAILSLFTPVTVTILGGLLLGFFISLMIMPGEATKDYTYDDLKIRFQRVKHQMVEQIKNGVTDKDYLEQLITDIEEMEEIIDETYIHRSMFSNIKNLFMSKHRQAKQDIELQQLLEQLTNNGLFVTSASLSLKV